MRLFKYLALFILLISATQLAAEPWIDTRDSWLRADIEMLAEIGIIKVPVSTYPLMWSGIIKDIDNASIENIPWDYKEVFWRVKKAGKDAIKKIEHKELKLALATSTPVFRAFGDGLRGKKEISARRYGLTDQLAWNVEITRNESASDGDKTRFDGSYFAFVIGNWVTSVGAVEKWWGAGWDSTNILSNYARPALGINLQRNYSNQSTNLLFRWLGPWTFNAFIAELDDEPFFKNGKYSGFSFTFKPFTSLELGLRATKLSDGEGIIEGSTNVADNHLISSSTEACNENECISYYSDIENRIIGFDLRWRLPLNHPVSFYASVYDEEGIPIKSSKNMTQFGLSSSFTLLNNGWKWFIESSESESSDKKVSLLFENNFYTEKNDYLFNSSSIFDNKFKTDSLGISSSLTKTSQLSVVYSHIKLNPEINKLLIENENITSFSNETKSQVKVKWQYKTYSYGDIDLSLASERMALSESLSKEYQLSISWSYQLN